MFRLFAILLVFLLAACSTTESARPLLDADSGVVMFGDGLLDSFIVPMQGIIHVYESDAVLSLRFVRGVAKSLLQLGLLMEFNGQYPDASKSTS